MEERERERETYENIRGNDARSHTMLTQTFANRTHITEEKKETETETETERGKERL
jgi:hypothetical protein